VLLAGLQVGVFDLLVLLDVLFAHVSELARHVTMQQDALTMPQFLWVFVFSRIVA
jgi:hypothetical protein